MKHMLLNRYGFTLIEMLIFVSLFGVIALASIGFLLSSVSSDSKSEVVKEARQNGGFAITTMEILLRSAATVSCDPGPLHRWVEFEKRSGDMIRFECTTIGPDSYIASNSSRLTSPNTVVTNCEFICQINPGSDPLVNIAFNISRSGSNLRVIESATIPYQTTVLLRGIAN